VCVCVCVCVGACVWVCVCVWVCGVCVFVYNTQTLRAPRYPIQSNKEPARRRFFTAQLILKSIQLVYLLQTWKHYVYMKIT